MVSKEQAKICAAHDVTPVACDPNLKVGVALATLGLVPLNALRHRPVNGTTGWYIWGGDLSDDPQFFQPLHAEHVEDHLPQLLPYLALPAGWRVLLAPGQADVWFDDGLLNVD